MEVGTAEQESRISNWAVGVAGELRFGLYDVWEASMTWPLIGWVLLFGLVIEMAQGLRSDDSFSLPGGHGARSLSRSPKLRQDRQTRSCAGLPSGGVHSFLCFACGYFFLRGHFLKRRNSAHLVLLSGLFSGLAFSAAQAPTAPSKPLTVEAIYQPGGLGGRGPEFEQWSPDGTKLSFVQRDDKGEHGELWYADAATGEKKVLVSAEKLASLAPDVNKVKNEREKERLTRYHVGEYLWAPDSKHLLFDSQGQLWLYDLGSQTAVEFTSSPDPSGYPKFSPDGTHVAYVRKHNLFVRPVSGKEEKQLTRDTSDDLLNGDIDWVYAEELGVRGNYFWSPDSKEIVFLHMDETKVPTYPITDWIPTHPTVDEQKYPRVGDPNPVVKVGVVDIEKGKVRWISLTADQDTYIPRFGWVREGMIWADVLNRTQDRLDLYFADAKTGKSRVVLTESTPRAWIDFEHLEARFLKNSGRILWPSWRDGDMHLYLYSFDWPNPMAADAKLERQLESGDYQVLGINGVDEAARTVFFQANKDDPRQEHMYSVQLDGSGFTALTSQEGFQAGDFSDDGKHYTQLDFGPQRSPKLSLCSVGGSCSPVWEARNEIAEYGLRAPKYLEFKAEDGTTLYGRLLLPPQDSVSGKIPLIVHIYGGPAGQTVTKSTPDPFDEIMARKGFAIFSVDNRGTPGRDRKFQTAIRHEFGAIELQDQLTALDQLLEEYPQLDKDRIGMWGWSNGGSMTLYSMTHSERFRAGVSVAPVTDARNYDSIYMERYFGLLKDDKEGYEQSDVARVADKLHGALLLVHGTGDDNVHFQNSVQMIDALIKAGKQFRLMIYPNKTHSIAGEDARVHLFTMIEEHFERELK
jgi:dipeptidyl-peptidase 4